MLLFNVISANSCIYVWDIFVHNGFVCVYVCMYVGMYVCMYVRMHVRMYVCMYVCMYVRMYVRYVFRVRYAPIETNLNAILKT